MPAFASMAATPEIALFTPDAAPMRSASTDSITTVVSGATAVAMPMPIITMAGRYAVQ